MGPGDLAEVLGGLRLYRPENLIVGFETGDDAAVYDMGESGYLVQTVDFITPVVDDGYTFGRISALNSMSDVYAMGGVPVTALSVFAYNCSVEKDDIRAMMQGAADEFASAGCALCGGHTVDDAEIKLGFSVTGVIKDKIIYKNVGLRAGDALIYTKKLGVGLVTTGIKAGMATKKYADAVIETMLISNRNASGVLRQFDVSACTDVTGFGLAGHAYEMASGSDVTAVLDSDRFALQEGALELASQFIIPAGAYSNMEFVKAHCRFKEKPENRHMVFFDPQTSGGLLIGVRAEQAEQMVRVLISAGYPDASFVGSVVEKSDFSVIID